MEQPIFIVFPHHLFHDISLLKGKRVLLVQEELFFKQYRFHIQKIILHRASMKAYETYLRSHAIDVVYLEDTAALSSYAKLCIEVYDPVDFDLEKKLKKLFPSLHIYPNPNFIHAQESANLLHTFYVAQRKKLGLLIDDALKPLGGKWSFDTYNRKKIPKNTQIAPSLCFSNSFIEEAKKYAKKYECVGECDDFYYPTTFGEAKILFEYFLEKKFASFGDYQDALVEHESFLFHSNISCALNIGILDLRYVIEKIAEHPTAPLNAKEGFLRQIIGWREYMLSFYKQKGVALRNSNFFGLKNHMPRKILQAKTSLAPLDSLLEKINKTAYAHHIERLMILGNIFLLLEIDPHDVHEFFMSRFIDAYDWVMVGNVYGMACYCQEGGVATKPYIASSNYLLKMGDYKKGPWCEVLDALYWSFVAKHADKLKSNHRMQMQLALLEKIDPQKLSRYKEVAKKFKLSLGMYSFYEEDTSRLIEMAWQDRTPFESIQKLYGMNENQVVKAMRKLMSKSSFTMWRERMQGRKTKHLKKLEHKPTRFQGPW